MNRVPGFRSDYLRAVTKTAQYLAGLTGSQDLWHEFGKVMTNFFGTDIVAFVEPRPDGKLSVHHCLAPDSAAVCAQIENLNTIIDQVTESGFLATETMALPEAYALVLVRIVLSSRRSVVMVVGHRAVERMPRELLDVYLAIAGLFESTLARILSEQRLRSMADNVPEMLFRLARFPDGSSRFNYVSKGAQGVLGLTPDELMHDGSLFAAGLYLVDKKAYEQALASASRVNTTFRWVGTGGAGEVKCIQMNAKSSMQSDGSVMWDGVVHDITERKRAEEALRIASAYNRRLIEASLDPLVTIGPDGHITDVNAATEAVTGRSRAELINTDFCEYFTDPTMARAGYEQVFREGLVRDYPLELRHADGNITPVLYNASVYRNEAGQVAGVFAAARDITERRKSEQALRESEARLKQAQQIAHLGSWELDLITNTLVWSDEIYRIFELERTAFDASYEAFLNAIHPEDRAAVDLAYTRSLSTHTPYSIDHRLLFPDGRIKYVHEQCETDYESGKPVRSLGTVQDITERKQSEEALRRVNRALKTLSSCNTALVHATSEDRLLEDISRIAVTIGGYRLAWAGLLDPNDSHILALMAEAGPEGRLELREHFLLDPESLNGCLAVEAIRTGSTQVMQRTLLDALQVHGAEEARQLGISAGASFPLRSESEVLGALTIYAVEPNAFSEEEIELLQELASDLAFGINWLRVRAARTRLEVERKRDLQRLEKSMEETVEAMAATIEMRDPYTAGHQRRVADLALHISRELGLPEKEINGIYLAACVHDIGKIHVPAEILSYPGKLSPIEFSLVQTHAKTGYEILKSVEFPWPVADYVLQHHERMDGSGYPNGLRADAILRGTRIISVADVVEAIAIYRPYREALGIEQALEEIIRHRGMLYDAEVVDVCVSLFRTKGYTLPVH